MDEGRAAKVAESAYRETVHRIGKGRFVPLRAPATASTTF